MNNLFTPTGEDHATVSQGVLFREADTKLNSSFSDTFKNLVHYNNQIAYILSHSGKFGYQHDHYVVIITLAAIKDLHWSLQGKFGESFDAPAGSVLIIPQGAEYVMSFDLTVQGLLKFWRY